jgi:hypothetical protein
VTTKKRIALITDRAWPQDVLIGRPTKCALDYVLLLRKAVITTQTVETTPLPDR